MNSPHMRASKIEQMTLEIEDLKKKRLDWETEKIQMKNL